MEFNEIIEFLENCHDVEKTLLKNNINKVFLYGLLSCRGNTDNMIVCF